MIAPRRWPASSPRYGDRVLHLSPKVDLRFLRQRSSTVLLADRLPCLLAHPPKSAGGREYPSSAFCFRRLSLRGSSPSRRRQCPNLHRSRHSTSTPPRAVSTDRPRSALGVPYRRSALGNRSAKRHHRDQATPSVTSARSRAGPAYPRRGSVDVNGMLHGYITRYARTDDARFSRMHPVEVVVTVDLTSGVWRTSQGHGGSDVLSLARWYWHGSVEADARRPGEMQTEDCLLAHLGLAALDVFAKVGGAQ